MKRKRLKNLAPTVISNQYYHYQERSYSKELNRKPIIADLFEANEESGHEELQFIGGGNIGSRSGSLDGDLNREVCKVRTQLPLN